MAATAGRDRQGSRVGGRPSRPAPCRRARSPSSSTSGAPSTRMQTYPAVHGPIPGRATKSAVSSSGARPGARATRPRPDRGMRPAGCRSVGAARRRPRAPVRRAPRKREHMGQPGVAGVDRLARRRRQPAQGGLGRRHRDLLPDQRSHYDLAPSTAPGSRAPGCRATAGASNGSTVSTAAIAVQSASASTSRRHRSRASEGREGRPAVAEPSPSPGRRARPAGGPPWQGRRSRRVRAYLDPVTYSTPATARCARNSSNPAPSNGARTGRRKVRAVIDRATRRPDRPSNGTRPFQCRGSTGLIPPSPSPPSPPGRDALLLELLDLLGGQLGPSAAAGRTPAPGTARSAPAPP